MNSDKIEILHQSGEDKQQTNKMSEIHSTTENNSCQSSAQRSAMTQRCGLGVMGMGERLKREGIYVYTQLIHTVVQKKLAQHCKAILLQFFKFLQIKTKIKQRKGQDWEEGEWLCSQGRPKKRDYTRVREGTEVSRVVILGKSTSAVRTASTKALAWERVTAGRCATSGSPVK